MSESFRGLLDELADCRRGVDLKSRFCVCEGLQSGQLAVHKAGGHVLMGAACDPVGDLLPAGIQVDEDSTREERQQVFAVNAPQRRTGNDRALTTGGKGDCFEPGPPVFVGERRPGGHLRLVCGRVQAVRVYEGIPR